MKKIYMQPQTAILKVETTGVLLSGSDPQANIDKTDGGIAPGSFGTKEQQDWDIWNE